MISRNLLRSDSVLRLWVTCQRSVRSFLPQQTPGSLVLITLQPGVDDRAGSTPDHHFLSALHIVAQVRQAALGVHLKLFLQGRTRTSEGSREHHDSPSTIQQLSLTRKDVWGQYLFLSCHPLLVPLPPGRVMYVEEGFVSCSNSTRSEQLKKTEERVKPWPRAS